MLAQNCPFLVARQIKSSGLSCAWVNTSIIPSLINASNPTKPFIYFCQHHRVADLKLLIQSYDPLVLSRWFSLVVISLYQLLRPIYIGNGYESFISAAFKLRLVGNVATITASVVFAAKIQYPHPSAAMRSILGERADKPIPDTAIVAWRGNKIHLVVHVALFSTPATRMRVPQPHIICTPRTNHNGDTNATFTLAVRPHYRPACHTVSLREVSLLP